MNELYHSDITLAAKKINSLIVNELSGPETIEVNLIGASGPISLSDIQETHYEFVSPLPIKLIVKERPLSYNIDLSEKEGFTLSGEIKDTDFEILGITPALPYLTESTYGAKIRVVNNGGVGSKTIEWQLVNLSDAVQDSGEVTTPHTAPGDTGLIAISGVDTPATDGYYKLRARIKDSGDPWTESFLFDIALHPTDINVVSVTPESGQKYINDEIDVDFYVFNDHATGSDIIEWELVDLSDIVEESGETDTGSVTKDSYKTVTENNIGTPADIASYKMRARIKDSGDAWVYSLSFSLINSVSISSVTPDSPPYTTSEAFDCDVVCANAGITKSETLYWQITDTSNNVQSSGDESTGSITGGGNKTVTLNLTSPSSAGTYKVRSRISTDSSWTDSSNFTVASPPDVEATGIAPIFNGSELEELNITITYSNSGGPGSATFHWRIKNSGGSIVDSGSGSKAVILSSGSVVFDTTYPAQGNGYYVEAKEDDDSSWEVSNTFNSAPPA